MLIHLLLRKYIWLALTLLLTGCHSVMVDREPVNSLGSSSFVINELSCQKLLSTGALLPLDIYYTGRCYELGVGMAQSSQQAEHYYVTAARWGVPEAVQALQRMGIPVPEPDLLKRQNKVGEDINQLHENKRQNQLEQERIKRPQYLLRPSCHGLHCWPHYHSCRHGWCY
ncbi:hypothetical protein [Endozoicomonas sp. Mp262]|uniref:hypothetical protein n=1 Tax=Endozoicomonas sp. Mp262 TaxID=2919499 RepID=UPI0021D8DE42